MTSIFPIATQAVRGYPARAILCVVSIALGTVTLTTAFAATQSLQQTIVHDAVLQGGPAQTLAISTPGRPLKGDLLSLYESDVRERSASTLISDEWTLDGLSMKGAQGAASVDVTLTESSLRLIRPFVIESGRWISDAPAFVPGVAVNRRAAAQGYTVGVPVEIQGQGSEPAYAIVVGVVDDGGPTPAAYLSARQAAAWVAPQVESTSRTLIVSGPSISIAIVQARINELQSLNNRREDVSVTRVDTVDSLDRTLASSESSLLAVAAIALLAALLAVTNVNLANARQRAPELAIRRALGAGQLTLVGLMLTEALLIGALGGLVAWPLSAVLYESIGGSLVHSFGGSLPPYPLGYGLLGLALGIVAALVSGIVPAFVVATKSIGQFARE